MSLAAIPLEVKQRLLRLHADNRIGWRAGAVQAYTVCAFLNALDNTLRSLIQQRARSKVARAQMPSFEALFRLPEAPRSFDAFTDWIDAMEDSGAGMGDAYVAEA